MASTASGISRTCCWAAASTHLCSKDVIVSCRKCIRYHLGRDDSKCKTQALRKINRTIEALYGSWWVPLLQKYLHIIKTFTYKFSQPLQLLFLNSHMSWPLKIHGHLVINVSGHRLDLQIDHTVTKPHLILNQHRCLKSRRRWALVWPAQPWLCNYLSSLVHHKTNKQPENGKDSVLVTLTQDCAQEYVKVGFYQSEQYSQKARIS